MQEAAEREIAQLKELVRGYGGVDSYSTEQAATIFAQLYKIMKEMGLRADSREEFRKGTQEIFDIRFLDMQDYTQGKYIFVPNHVSEFDGLLFGTLIPHMLVVAKSDWISNPQLNGFIDKLFSIVGVVRKDRASGMNALKSCIEHIKAAQDSAVTIFVQQTIADIDHTSAEDIASGAFYIAKKTSAQLIPVYCEQISVDEPTRLVFGKAMDCTDKDEFGRAWLESEISLRDSLSDPPARAPRLCEKHQKPISQRDF